MKSALPSALRRVLPSGSAQRCAAWAGGLMALALAGALLSTPVTATEGGTSPIAAPSANVLARQERQRISNRVWRTDSELTTATETSPPWSDDAKLIEQGRRIYMEGLRPDGQPLVGRRLDGQIRISGA
jgi:hypothetical protein